MTDTATLIITAVLAVASAVWLAWADYRDRD